MSNRSLVLSVLSSLLVLLLAVLWGYRQWFESDDRSEGSVPVSEVRTGRGDPSQVPPMSRVDVERVGVGRSRVSTSPRLDSVSVGRVAEDDPSPLEPLPDSALPGALSVFVEDASGDAVAELGVRVRLGTKESLARTDDGGEARFDELAPGSYQVFVRQGEEVLQAEQNVEVLSDDLVEFHYLLPENWHSVSGVVVDSLKNLLSDVEVSISSLNKVRGETLLFQASGVRSVRSGEDGAFEFSGLPQGDFEIFANAGQGFAQKRENVMSPAGELEIVVYRAKEIFVEGRAVDGQGRGISEVWVSVVNARERTKTDEDGNFELSVLVELNFGKPLAILGRKQGYRAVEERLDFEKIQENDTLEVDLVLEGVSSLSTVEGRLEDREGNPVPGEAVYMRSAEMKLRYLARSGDEGEFVFEDIPSSSDYRLWINPSELYRDKVVHPFNVHPGKNSVELVLDVVEINSVKGVFLDANGDPVPSYTFRVRSVQARSQAFVGTTDEEGQFLVEGVPSGNLLFHTISQPILRVRGAELNTDEPLEVEVVIGLGDETFTAVLVDNEGRPVSGAKLSATWIFRKEVLLSQMVFEGTADSDGQVVFEGLAHGSYEVRIRAPGFKTHEGEFKLSKGEATELSFTLEK